MSTRIRKPFATAMGILAVAIVLPACGDDTGDSNAAQDAQAGSSLPQGSEPSNLNAEELTPEIDNPYLPFKVGSKWVYEGTEGNEEAKIEVSVTNDTKQIANGVTARVVRDTESDAKTGDVLEATDDWFAQDAEGNVWYLGEDTKEYEEGEVSTEGSFEAGVDGADAGIVMPAEPQVGMSYRMEYFDGEAQEEAEVASLDEQAEVPFGDFTDVLMTKDIETDEPEVEEHKFYARGVGLVLATNAAEDAREELVSYTEGK